MKDNRPLPKTNGVVKEINVFEVAPLKLVTFRLTFLFRLRYAGCFRVCAKSAIRKIDLERNRSLKEVPAQGCDSISATKYPITFTMWSSCPHWWTFSWTENVFGPAHRAVQTVSTEEPTVELGQIASFL